MVGYRSEMAILSITCMAIYSMSQGHNGTILLTAIAVVSGICGHSIIDQIRELSVFKK